ncbi:MAG: peptidoglycan DD-metalloendopeptidase family protein [Patescibacteria group bacterium]|nr:peptidoglycan DD-metalloendopeptidase family protein [Patescibacteria group bacterium]
MFFPDLKGAVSCGVSLNALAVAWHKQHGQEGQGNPLLDPAICQKMIDEFHRARKADYSYGGYMENRPALWRGTYLDATESYLHLGVDFNVPAGTRVCPSVRCTVVYIDHDPPGEKYGWGTRVIVRLKDHDLYAIYAHLDRSLMCQVGDELEAETLFGKVGLPSCNGGWFPHLHVQLLIPEVFMVLTYDPKRIDGYGIIKDIQELSRKFPDPLAYLKPW